MSLHTSLTRREALVKMAAVMVTASLLPYSTITHAERAQAASAPLEYAQFLQISQKITGFEPLDVALSARYFSALNARFPQLSQHLSALYALSQQAADAQVFNQMARERGMAETIQAIVTAWYTGTVDPASSLPDLLWDTRPEISESELAALDTLVDHFQQGGKTGHLIYKNGFPAFFYHYATRQQKCMRPRPPTIHLFTI